MHRSTTQPPQSLLPKTWPGPDGLYDHNHGHDCLYDHNHGHDGLFHHNHDLHEPSSLHSVHLSAHGIAKLSDVNVCSQHFVQKKDWSRLLQREGRKLIFFTFWPSLHFKACVCLLGHLEADFCNKVGLMSYQNLIFK